MPVVGVEPTRVISTRDFEFLSASSIWCHPVISSDIWFPLCKGKIHASTNNNLKYPRFFDAFFLYSVFSVWTAQMEIGGMFRRDAGQNAPLLRHKTKGKPYQREKQRLQRLPGKTGGIPPLTDCQGQYRPDFTPGTQACEKAGTGAIKTAPKCTRTHTEQGGCPVPYPQYQRIF